MKTNHCGLALLGLLLILLAGCSQQQASQPATQAQFEDNKKAQEHERAAQNARR